MIKGLYTSASGMIPRIRRQDILANNLANAKTTGYKKDDSFTRELTRAEEKFQVRPSDWERPLENQMYVDLTPGVFDQTGNPLDLAIDGDGFFLLEDADGQQFLTRAGTFEINSEGLMSFPGDLLLVSGGGTIQVGNGQVTVGLNGEVEVDGSAVGTITPVTVDDISQLTKVGRTLFAVPEGVELQTVENASVQQGYLEASNVDVVRHMVDMIISYREYEANARALQTQDESLSNLFNRVGS